MSGLTANVPRRTLLAGGAAALVPSTAGGLVAGRALPALGTGRGCRLIWHRRGPLAGYGVSAECNPGGTTGFACGTSDVAIAAGRRGTGRFTEVTANPRGIVTFVNAIGNIHFQGHTPDGRKLALNTFRYVYAVRLPLVPTKTSAPHVAEQVHQMIQFWDGSNSVWKTARKHTLEAAMFWKLNPWDPNYGKVFAYTMDGHGKVVPHDTGIRLKPDTRWHVFEVRADLAKKVWARVGVDGHFRRLRNLPLARVHHPDWGKDVSLILTAESENAYPGSANPIVTQWTTQFKDPKLFRLA